jgi:hypothetical protein
MTNHIFIAPGDITQLSADAIAFSASNSLGADGNLYSSFEAHVEGFAEFLGELRRSQELPCPVGSTFWMPSRQPRKPHGVVVVVSTGRQAPVEDKAGLAVRNALTTAAARLRDAGHARRLLIALPAFRVGKGGDRRQRLQSARAQVAAARETLAGMDNVDVAFLTYTPALYRIFLEARRELLGPPPAGVAIPAGLLDALCAGSCVLFAGAGLSAGAGLPAWNELVARLAGDLGITPAPHLDHLDLAQWYREQFGQKRLAEVVRSTYGEGAGLPTLAHYLLLHLPLRHVITTNYDDLIERALHALKRHPVPVVRQQEVARTGASGSAVYVVKLHGDAAHPDDIVLSRDDYHEFFERRPAMALLLEGLLLNQTFFFAGYSLRDLNFRQVFSRVARLLREAHRPAFATTFEAGGDTARYALEQWQRQQLHLIPIPGATHAEQGQGFLRFLDRLSDEVTMRQAPLALAPDLPAPAPLGRLRELLQQAGDELETLLDGPVLPGQTRYVAEVLRFLIEHGWRPAARGKPMCALWEALAEHTSDPVQRRQFLVAALGCAEAFADARRIREQLGREPGPSAP